MQRKNVTSPPMGLGTSPSVEAALQALEAALENSSRKRPEPKPSVKEVKSLLLYQLLGGNPQADKKSHPDVRMFSPVYCSYL